jgi:hypothetical protein
MGWQHRRFDTRRRPLGAEFSGETLDVALFNAEVQSKTLVD